MRQQNQECLAEWIESLATKIDQDPTAHLSEVDQKIYLTDVGNKHAPELARLSDAFLQAGGWGHKLSSDYIEQRILEVLLGLLEAGTTGEALPLLERLSESLQDYDEQRTVYIPITGIEMTDVDEVTFGEVILKKMRVAQKEELAKDFEAQEDRERFFDRVGVVPYAEIIVSAEPVKAWEIAGDRIGNVLDLLRYSVPFLSPEDADPDINMLGQNRNSPPLVAVYGGKVENLFESLRYLPTNLELSRRAVEEMEEAEVFEVAKFMDKEVKTDLERRVMRSIQWASNSQGQHEPENRLLSLVISLESVLPSPRRTSGGTGAWTAEGAAILLGRDLSTRRAIRNKILGLYRKRNNIVHGGENEEITTEDIVWLRGTVHDLIKTIIKNRDEYEMLDGTYAIARWLEDYKLTPK